MDKELQIPKDVLEVYQVSQNILSSVNSDIIHLQSDLKAYVEVTGKVIYNLVEKIEKLESEKKDVKVEPVKKG